MNRIKPTILLLMLIITSISGCASLKPNRDTPTSNDTNLYQASSYPSHDNDQFWDMIGWLATFYR